MIEAYNIKNGVTYWLHYLNDCKIDHIIFLIKSNKILAISIT